MCWMRKRGTLCINPNEPNVVYDCSGNILFEFGGVSELLFGTPCLGELESQDLTNFETIFDMTNGSYPVCATETVAAIPTLGQWGLISLSLLLLIFASQMVKIQAKQNSSVTKFD